MIPTLTGHYNTIVMQLAPKRQTLTLVKWDIPSPKKNIFRSLYESSFETNKNLAVLTYCSVLKKKAYQGFFVYPCPCDRTPLEHAYGIRIGRRPFSVIAKDIVHAISTWAKLDILGKMIGIKCYPKIGK